MLHLQSCEASKGKGQPSPLFTGSHQTTFLQKRVLHVVYKMEVGEALLESASQDTTLTQMQLRSVHGMLQLLQR